MCESDGVQLRPAVDVFVVPYSVRFLSLFSTTFGNLSVISDLFFEVPNFQQHKNYHGHNLANNNDGGGVEGGRGGNQPCLSEILTYKEVKLERNEKNGLNHSLIFILQNVPPKTPILYLLLFKSVIKKMLFLSSKNILRGENLPLCTPTGYAYA